MRHCISVYNAMSHREVNSRNTLFTLLSKPCDSQPVQGFQPMSGLAPAPTATLNRISSYRWGLEPIPADGQTLNVIHENCELAFDLPTQHLVAKVGVVHLFCQLTLY